MNSKKLWASAILLVLVASLVACSKSKSPSELLVGEWEGSYEGEKVVMTFNKDGEITISGEGYSQTASYTADFSFEPAHLDIETEDGTVKTIIEFIDDDTLHMENNFPGEPRPTAFGEDDVTFKRR